MEKNLKYIFFLFLAVVILPLKGQDKTGDIDSINFFYNQKNFNFEKKFDNIYEYMLRTVEESTKSLPVLRKLLVKAEKLGDSLRIAKANYLIGVVYANKENYLLALDFYYKALPYAQNHQDTAFLIKCNNSIGIAFSCRRQHKKAAEYFLKNVALHKAKKNEFGVGISYNNVAIEYIELKKFTEAEKYLRECYRTLVKFKQMYYVSTVVMNLGVVRFERAQYDSALYYYRLSRDLEKKHASPVISDNTSNNLGHAFCKLKQYDSALYYCKYTLAHIDTLNSRYTVKETYKIMSEVYHNLGDDKRAFYYLQKYHRISDLIFDDESIKKTVEDESNYNYLKVENQLKLSQQQRLNEEKSNRMKLIFFSAGGLLLLIALAVVFYRFREKKKANAILTNQKNRIEFQQKEITDSISYAKRIQDSILPSHSAMQKSLGEHVLFYLPKDIVGGDFYFVERVHNKKYFAVIDCTGHGVPGGFMSMLGYNAINNALLDLKIEEPGKILDCLSKNLVEHFTQEGKATLRDGMDMALCCLFEKDGKHILEYAGAHNPCWIIKHTSFELIELKATKQPIGYFENFKPFTTQTVEVEKGDMIYLFSDGYPDQFGGPRGKKFKYSQLKTVLQQYAPTAIEKQEIIAKAFEEWKGNQEQMDDVCILGVRV
ncbi:MAG TPA: SpoIIE family protein phosphatase [Flavobacteriales bacterium]|nr:SpoIIE family protein phosphatase [Flavobacteriales bacterium]